jgi:hypothetical protein
MNKYCTYMCLCLHAPIRDVFICQIYCALKHVCLVFTLWKTLIRLNTLLARWTQTCMCSMRSTCKNTSGTLWFFLIFPNFFHIFLIILSFYNLFWIYICYTSVWHVISTCKDEYVMHNVLDMSHILNMCSDF